MAWNWKVVCVVVVVVMVGVAESAVTCGTVSSRLGPCVNYLRGMSRVLPPACCAGVRGINNAARTTPDRQMACNCIKSAATKIPGINHNLASSLPSNCGFNIPYKISPDTDCKSVK